MSILSRIPTIPLDYSERDKAIEKELLVDYGTGKIYVVSSYDRTVIFDLTSKISEYLQQTGISGDSLTVNIEGLGNVDLGSIISLLYNQEGATMVEEVDPLVVQMPSSGYQYDLKSVLIKDSKVQIYGFDEAPDGSIPQKSAGIVKWTTVDSAASNSVTKLLPADGIIQLTEACNQMVTIEDNDTYIIVPPFVSSGCNQIRLNLTVNCDLDPIITFSDNIVWQSGVIRWTTDVDTPDFCGKSVNIITLTTWNEGNTWLAKIDNFDMPSGYTTD